ncbi:hypothetical protein CRUP_024125 [Coryphaenoides rupestris]|nr:hypothetical protein CRUP_024125 [Coryphaenoides rupestris]
MSDWADRKTATANDRQRVRFDACRAERGVTGLTDAQGGTQRSSTPRGWWNIIPSRDECHRMNTAGGVCLSVLSTFLAVAGALAAASALAPLSALAAAAAAASTSGAAAAGVEGSLSAASSTPSSSSSSSPCSSLVAGVLYGSFSLRELFPSRQPGCSWSLENPDPTKYSLYLRFTRHPAICQTHSPMLLSLDHHLANQSCPPQLRAQPPKDQDVVDLCGDGRADQDPHAFLQFDKNFVQLCLTRHPAPNESHVTKETLELRLVEVLLINNENSSQFTCGVLCRWFEECLRSGRHGDSGGGGGDHDGDGGDGCGMTQTGCICPNHNIAAAPAAVPLLPATPHAASNGSLVPDDCCVTEMHSNDAIAIAPRDVRQGDPAAEEWSQWSVCSLTCGQGWQVRTRSCVSSPYGTLCSGALRETRMCNNTAACPGDPGIISPGASRKLSALQGGYSGAAAPRIGRHGGTGPSAADLLRQL